MRGKVSINSLDRIKDRAAYSKAVKSTRSVVLLILASSFVIFLAIALYAIWQDGLANFVDIMESINFSYFIAALGVVFVSYAMRYPKWDLYLRRLGVHLPFRKNFMIYMSMYSMEMTPGRWGRAVVSYTINKLSKVRFALTFPAVVADIFTDFLGFAVIADVAALLVNRFVVVSFILTILLMIPFFFVYVKSPYDYVKEVWMRHKKRFKILHRLNIVASTADLYFKYNERLGVGPFIYSMVLTVPSMFLNGMALFLIMESFGVHLTTADIPIVMFIFSSSIIVGIITGIPGALGVTDAALIGQLQFFFGDAINASMASAITILFRVASMWFVAGFGFASLLYTMRYWKS